MSFTTAELLQRMERCFDQGEIETLTRRTSGQGVYVRRADAAVKVRHRASGLEAMSEKHSSQILNRAVALLELLNKLLEETQRG